MKRLKYFIPSIFIMIFIFMMSHTPADESTIQSGFFQTLIYQLIHIHLPMFIVRKAAHMTEYALLCLSFYYGLVHTSHKQFYLPVVLTFLYACSDEYHQLFITGRSGQISDVLLDTSAAVSIMLIVLIINKLYRKSSDTQ